MKMKRKISGPTKEVAADWHLIDARDKILGRLASQISVLLMGKHKPYYSPNLDCGDHVVVINAEKITVTGGKADKKLYYRHSGYPGGLKEESLRNLLARRPEEVIRRAVSGMLPKNKLRSIRLKKLHVYKGPNHKHQSQFKKV